MSLPQSDVKPMVVLRAAKLVAIPSVILLVAVVAGTANAQTREGTATYRERMVFPSAEAIARTRIPLPGNPPITSGNPTKVSLLLRRVPPGETPLPTAGVSTPLENTYWKAIELAGQPTPAHDANREAYLRFQGGRVSGSDGCNQLTGSYQLNGDRVTFGQMAGTLMACPDSSSTEGPFRDALKNASRLRIAGDRLELFDAAGTRLAAFTAGRQPSASSPSLGLAGTSWQLVKFQSSDDTTLTPDDRAKYTIEFAAGGELTARIDCNRGHGTWKTSGPNQIEFGPLALTRAKCPPGSLHDQIMKQWGNIRSYVIRDGHLFLALMADGGIYEFEPSPAGR